MKNLVILAHPNPKSFCKAIADIIIKVSEIEGIETKFVDLYQTGFNPILSGEDIISLTEGNIPEDIIEQQDYIKNADLITIIYPVWWTGFPAILKGYIDRVFVRGFAYEYVGVEPRGLLEDKKVLLLSTTGSTVENLSERGLIDAMKKITQLGIFGFCGVKNIKHHFFGSIPSSTEDLRKSYLIEAEKILKETLKEK